MMHSEIYFREKLQAPLTKQISGCIHFFVRFLVTYILVVTLKANSLCTTVTRNGKKGGGGKEKPIPIQFQPSFRSVNQKKRKVNHLDLINIRKGVQLFLMSPSSETSIPSDSHELHAKNEYPPAD